MVHYCATKQWLVCCGRLMHRPYAHWLSLLYVMMADRWSCLQEAQASSQASTCDVITFAVTDTFWFPNLWARRSHKCRKMILLITNRAVITARVVCEQVTHGAQNEDILKDIDGWLKLSRSPPGSWRVPLKHDAHLICGWMTKSFHPFTPFRYQWREAK